MKLTAEYWLKLREGDALVIDGGGTQKLWHCHGPDDQAGKPPIVLLQRSDGSATVQAVMSGTTVNQLDGDALFIIRFASVRWRVAISEGQAKTVCNEGLDGFRECRWFMRADGKPQCYRTAPLSARKAVETGSRRYHPELCAGPPDYERIPQPEE